MNIKALITTLAVLGSSSVAMARPLSFSASARGQVSWGTSSGPVIRDHRDLPQRFPQPQPRPMHVYQNEWSNSYETYAQEPQPLMLAEGLTFNSTEFRKDVIVGMDKGRFNSIQINAEGGQTYVQKVGIEFSNGVVQLIPVNRTLRGSQSMSFDLDGSN